MSKKTKDINEVLDGFAHEIAEDAKNEESLEQKVDAFKALTAYAALRHKMSLKGRDLDEDGETTMAELANVIQMSGREKK